MSIKSILSIKLPRWVGIVSYTLLVFMSLITISAFIFPDTWYEIAFWYSAR